MMLLADRISDIRMVLSRAARIYPGDGMDPFKPYTPRAVAAAPPRLRRDDAEVVAIRAIAFISGDDALLSRFVALTGCGVEELRGRLTDAVFLGAVLDFLLGDEAAVLAFVAQAGLRPETPMLARGLLP
jgi:hypothetical protein